jgi:hypothetical protein
LLDPVLLGHFINSFVGYGNLDAHVWFIGMEEGGGITENEIRARLQAWVNRGRMQIEDLRDFHIACSQIQANQAIVDPREVAVTNRLDRHFAPNARVQFTWRRIIRTIRANLELNVDPDEMRQYQLNSLARYGSHLAILELFPLPSPGSSTWNYGPVGPHKNPEKTFPEEPWTDVAYMQTRGAYQHQVREVRRDILRALIGKHQPEAVVFYGETWRDTWCEIADIVIEPQDYGLHGIGETRYMILPHPSARRNQPPPAPPLPSTNSLFEQAGNTLRNHAIVL